MIKLNFIDEPIFYHGIHEEFPWREYTRKQLMDEFIKLRKKLSERIKFPIKRSIIGYSCSNYFFQKERLSTKRCSNRKDSAIEYWNNPKGKKAVLKHSNKHNRDIFNSIVFLSHAPAQFPVAAAGKIYKYFNATNVFDPYAGWGDRCIAAMACNINYTGVDSNKNIQNNYIDMINFFDTEANIKFISSKVEDINYKDFDFDLIFSSPPFWQDNLMVECYKNCNDDYESFLEKSLFPIIKEGLRRNIRVCLHLPLQMYNDILKVFGITNKIIEINKNTNQNTDKIYCW